ncbi:putative soluble epoxide hydrolase [Tanacetum coccineum]
MEEIKHGYIKVNGLNLHVAEIGSESSPAVIFLHGFPEIWYTWRNQMIEVAKAGYRAVFVISKDFGGKVGYVFALLRPEKIAGVIALGAPFGRPGATGIFTSRPEGFYIRRWQEPGRAEAEFRRLDAKTVVRNIYILLSKSEISIAAENQEIVDLVQPSNPLPSWFTEEDLLAYGALYDKSGFQTALHVPYRTLVLLIVGEKDYSLKFSGMQEYLKSKELKKYVPKLEIIYLAEGCHFVQEQFPKEVNRLILDFLDRNQTSASEPTEDVIPWPGNANMAFDLRPTEDVLPWSGNANMAFDLRPTEDVLLWQGNANMAFDLQPTEDVLPWPGNANMAFDLRSTEDDYDQEMEAHSYMAQLSRDYSRSAHDREISTLTNFVEKFLGTVKFGNDQIAPILGYGDLVQGTITIKRVYYVEGLNHNLFSVGQFCDADLEVAFRKSTCYIRDLKGNDLLTGSRGTDLYSITLQDSTTPNPICLMAKATSSQAWLWHRRLSHLNFDTINLLSKNNIVNGLPKLKFVKDHLCSSCELGKAKRNGHVGKNTYKYMLEQNLWGLSDINKVTLGLVGIALWIKWKRQGLQRALKEIFLKVYKKLGGRWGKAACLRVMVSDRPMSLRRRSIPSLILWKGKDAEGPSLDESLENEEHLDVDSCDSDSPKNVNMISEEIQTMVKDRDKYIHEDQEFKKKEYAYSALEEYLYYIKNKIKEYDFKKRVHPKSLGNNENVVAHTTMWLLDNLIANVKELQRMKNDLLVVSGSGPVVTSNWAVCYTLNTSALLSIPPEGVKVAFD